MLTEPAVPGVIDVYADTVPGPRQRTRDFRPMPMALPGPVHDFRTPDLATPSVERPSTWLGSALGRA